MSKPTRSITTLPRSLLTQSKAGPSRLPPSRSRLTRPLHSTSSSSKPATSSSKPVFSSINSTEISHFSRLSSQWWDPTGEFSLLHRMNPTRIEYIGQKVALDSRDEEEWTFAGRHGDRAREEGKGVGRWLEGRRCLDVGCGGGLLSESLARLGGDVVGADASESNITIANLHASRDPFLPYSPSLPEIPASTSWSSLPSTPPKRQTTGRGSLEYRHTSAEALRDAGETFDLICAMEVLEHVDEPGEFLKSLGNMVKPGGHLILSTISRTPLSQLLTLTLAESILRLVTPGTHTYSKFVKPTELRAFVFAEMGGFDVWEENDDAGDVRRGEVGETRGIVFDPVMRGWRLWGGAEGTWGKGLGEGCNYLFHARKRK